MENAIDALKMAAGVLIFVMALSISINAFGQAREAATVILENNDREYETQYTEGNLDDAGNPVTTRLVGMESIIPTIYKAYMEKNRIVFSTALFDHGIYKITENGSEIEMNEFDMESLRLSNKEMGMEFIKGILYGKNKISDEAKRFLQDNGIILNDEGIYDIIGNRKVKEEIGLYYELTAEEEAEGFVDKDNVDITKIKRVITYNPV